MKPLLSIVVSAYNEEGNVEKLYSQIVQNLDQISHKIEYEILFVNDGSSDKTLDICKKIVDIDTRVSIIDFDRNFGHEVAMTAGLDHANGDAVVFMDADLQHPPEYLPKMINAWLDNGYEIVLTKCIKNEQKTFWRNILVNAYYKIINLLSDIEIPRATPDFRLISRRYIDILRTMDEKERMFRGLINWLGIKNAKIIEFVAPERFSGTTHYNMKASIKLALNSIIQFSIKPLRLATYLGLITAVFGIIFGIWTAIEHFLYNRPSDGYATIILAIVIFASIQMIMLGIIGEYIGRIHIEVKRRPLYFAKIIKKDT